MKATARLAALAVLLGGAVGCSDNASTATPNFASPPPQDSGLSAGKSPPGKAAPMTGGSTGTRLPAAPGAGGKKQ